MLRIFIPILFFIFSFVHAEPEQLVSKPQALEMLKGTVIHVFEDVTSGQEKNYNRVAKTRIYQDGTPEIVLIDVPETPVKIDDKIYIARLDSPQTFGLGDTLEYKLSFVDFARDNYAIFILLPLLLLLIFANKKAKKTIELFFLNIVLILVFLPLCVKFHIPTFLWAIIFLSLNTYAFFQIFPSPKYQLAVYTAMPTSLLVGFIYSLFNSSAKINEYQIIKNSTLMPANLNLANIDWLTILVSSFIIYLFTSILFIRHTFKENLYTNFSNTVWKITLLYTFIILGLHLPTFIYFIVNGLGFFNLFNYLPFAQSFFKFMFVYLGNVLCCLAYLTAFYYKHKQFFQKHLQIKEQKWNTHNMDLTAIVSQRKETKYNEPLPQAKKKARIIRQFRVTRKRILKQKKTKPSKKKR